MFSFKSGLAFLALRIAITIVTTIVMSLIVVLLLGGSLQSEREIHPAHAATTAVIAALCSVTVMFLVADKLFPPLCKWVGK